MAPPRPSLHFLLRLLLSSLGPRRLRRVLWGRRRLAVSLLDPHLDYSVLLIHPLSALHWGVSPNQIVSVSFDILPVGPLSRPLSLSRLMRVSLSSSLPPSSASLSTSDIFNISPVPLSSISIVSLLPFRRLRDSSPLPHADSIRLSPVLQSSPPPSDFTSSLPPFFSQSRVVYNGDVVAMRVVDPLLGTETMAVFRLESSPRPSVLVDGRTSIYELSPVHSRVPFGQSLSSLPYSPSSGALPLPLPVVPPSINDILNKMTQLQYAQGKLPSPPPLSFLLSGSSGSGKRLLVAAFASRTHQNWMEVSCLDIWNEVSSQAESKLRASFTKARGLHPCILFLSSVDALGYDVHSRGIDSRVLSSLRSLLDSSPSSLTVILGCSTRQLPSLSPSLRSSVLYDFFLPPLVEEDRRLFLSSLLPRPVVASLVKSTAGFVLSELRDLVADAQFIAHRGGRSRVREEDAEEAIEQRNRSIATAVGTAKVPSVSWEDIGGLEESKRIIRESIQLVLRGGSRVKRSGIILFGPPGCGKTLLAKAVATEYKIAFLSVKGPELLNKYVGQSEENLRNVFERARAASPCVIFFDELDSIAPNRGRHGDSGGVMDRIVSSLLAELDDLQSSADSQVFVMAATNRADLLDPALLSPGRFDKVVNVSPGTDAASKAAILRAVSRSVQLGEDVEMEEVAAACPSVMSGAELYSIVSKATMESIREAVSLIEEGAMGEEEADLRVGQRHLLQALANGRHVK